MTTPGYTVPFNRPFLVGTEMEHLHRALASGHFAGDGPATEAARKLLSQVSGLPHALLTTSCTHALEMAAILLDIGPGDEVVVPDFTFVSTANAFALRGATVVLADIRSDTFNLDEQLVDDLITDRTRAVVTVHYGGVGSEPERLHRLCADRGIALVDDNANGLGASWGGRTLGSFGVMATQSFHETKNVQCGEGGALLTGDPELMERAEIIREKGTNRSRFFRGVVDKYTWVDVGSSYLLSDVLAAILNAQLASFEDIQERRHRRWSTYRAELSSWAVDHGVHLQTVPSEAEHPAHVFAMLMPNHQMQEDMLRHCRSHGVGATFHYLPLHESPAGRRFGRPAPAGCPVSISVAGRLASPFHVGG